MGELIRKAREESGVSQADLVENIYRRRATLSDMENGKAEVSSGTLALLAAALSKPITYFYPQFLYKELEPEKLGPLEQELLTSFRNIWDEHLQKVALEQVMVIANFDPKDMIWDLVDVVKSTKE
jgi:transcriptional regulator with XRE-family HTH domain